MTVIKAVSILDDYGNEVEATIMNQLKVAENHRIAGGLFQGSALDTNFFTATVSAGGTVAVSNMEGIVSTTTTSGSSAAVATTDFARYIATQMNYFRGIIRMDAGATNNVRTWGACDGVALNDGCAFRLSGTTLQLGCIKGGSAAGLINAGSWNGDGTQSGVTYSLDTNYHTYEIYYTTSKCKFVIDGVIMHTMKATNTSLTNTRVFKPVMINTNTGVGSAVAITAMAFSIARYGVQTSQPKGYFQQGLTAGVLLKTGAGSIHSINLSGIADTSVLTLYDGTSTGGTVLYTTGTMVLKPGNNSVPVTLNFDSDGGVQFSTGLFLAITTAACNALIKYE